MEIYFHPRYNQLWANILDEDGKSIVDQIAAEDLSLLKAEEVFGTSENINIDISGDAIKVLSISPKDFAILYPYDTYMGNYGYQVIWYSIDGFDFQHVEILQDAELSACPRTYFLVQEHSTLWYLYEFIETKYRYPFPSSTIRTIACGGSRNEVIEKSDINFNSLDTLYASKTI